MGQLDDRADAASTPAQCYVGHGMKEEPATEDPRRDLSGRVVMVRAAHEVEDLARRQ